MDLRLRTSRASGILSIETKHLEKFTHTNSNSARAPAREDLHKGRGSGRLHSGIGVFYFKQVVFHFLYVLHHLGVQNTKSLSAFATQKRITGAGEMAHWLRVLGALSGHPEQPMTGSSQKPITPVSEDLVLFLASGSTCTYVHSLILSPDPPLT